MDIHEVNYADDQIRSVRTTFGDFRSIIKQEYLKQIPLDTQEQSFLDKVVKTIPEGELVLNNPMDGSFLAYGSDGLRVTIATHQIPQRGA